MKRARPVAALLCATMCAGSLGCFSSATVPGGGIAAMKVGASADGTVVRTESGDAVRLDPNSTVRFVRSDGTVTPGVKVKDLWVSDDGVFLRRAVAPEALHAARVTGVSEAEEKAIRETAPAHAHVGAAGDGKLELHDDGGSLAPWARAVRERLGRLPGGWTFHLTPDVGPFAGDSLARALEDGVGVVDGLRWSDVTSAEIENFKGGETAVVVVAVTAVAVGIIALAVGSKGKLPLPDLGNVAGAVAKTTVHVAKPLVQVTAKAAETTLRVAPHLHPHVAHIHVGNVGNVGNVGGSGSSGSGGSSSSASSSSSSSAPTGDTGAEPGNGTAATTEAADQEETPEESTAAMAASGGPMEETPARTSSPGTEDYATLGKPGFEAPDATDGRPVFGGVARRRSVVKLVGALDFGRDLADLARLHGGAIVTARFLDFFEIGGGIRWLSPAATTSTLSHDEGAAGPATSSKGDFVVVSRLGMHGELDVHRRLAFPFAVDFGRGGDVKTFMRLNWGLRIRLHDELWVGLYPFNPTYADRARPPPGQTTAWSFPSSLEASFVF